MGRPRKKPKKWKPGDPFTPLQDPHELAEKEKPEDSLPSIEDAPAKKGTPREVEYLNKIKEGVPPERIPAILEEVIQVSKNTNSWRGLMAVAQFVADYGLGKPTQRIDVSNIATPADWEDVFADDDDEENEEPVDEIIARMTDKERAELLDKLQKREKLDFENELMDMGLWDDDPDHGENSEV